MSKKTRKQKGTKRKPASRPTDMVRRDSASVRIRFSPQKIGGLWYESWLVEYFTHGRRCRERQKTERKAKAHAETVATRLAEGDLAALELRGEDRRIYLAAVSYLKDIDVALDVAAREFADAKKIAKRADLRGVARFYDKYARSEVKPIKVALLAKEFVAGLEKDKRSAYHVRDMTIRLERFAKAFDREISEVTSTQIDDWLQNLTSLAKGCRRDGPLKGRSRNNYRNAVVELFNYAKRHGYLPRDLSTEAEATNRVPEHDKRDNEIFTPDQIADLLNHAPPKLVPGMAIKAFSGMRTEECALMQWENIAFRRGKGYLILPKAITKKKRRRIPPILPNLRKWLEPFEGLTGRICARWSTPQTMFQAWERFALKRKIKAGGNRFRNSYISYRVAQTSDPEKVALESGNSAKVIMEDYLELATPEEAAKWFKVSPSAQQLKAIKAYAEKLKLAQAGSTHL